MTVVLALAGCAGTQFERDLRSWFGPSKPPPAAPTDSPPAPKRVVAQPEPAPIFTEFKLEESVDEVDKIRWYKYPGGGGWLSDESWIEVYIGQSTTGGKPWMRMRAIRMSVFWLMSNSITVVADEKRFDRSADFKSDYRGDKIWEIYDTRADMEMIRAIANAKDAVFRYRGERGTRDHHFTDGQKAMMRTMLAEYAKMGGDDGPAAPNNGRTSK